jgi:hypothetical protein
VSTLHSLGKKHLADCARLFRIRIESGFQWVRGYQDSKSGTQKWPPKAHALKTWPEKKLAVEFFCRNKLKYFLPIFVIKILDPDPGKDPDLDSMSLDPNHISKKRKVRII